MKMTKAQKGNQALRLSQLQEEKRKTNRELYPSSLSNSPMRSIVELGAGATDSYLQKSYFR
jgi:hypothetical protein